eukprot:scaffold164_cov212-Alexandrium_tamarense.AAC.15
MSQSSMGMSTTTNETTQRMRLQRGLLQCSTQESNYEVSVGFRLFSKMYKICYGVSRRFQRRQPTSKEGSP